MRRFPIFTAQRLPHSARNESPMNTTPRPVAPANPPARKSITLLQMLAIIGIAGVAGSALFRYFL